MHEVQYQLHGSVPRLLHEQAYADTCVLNERACDPMLKIACRSRSRKEICQILLLRTLLLLPAPFHQASCRTFALMIFLMNAIGMIRESCDHVRFEMSDVCVKIKLKPTG